jgi:hypothetical protein
MNDHETHGYGPGERPDDCPECLAEAEAESAGDYDR